MTFDAIRKQLGYLLSLPERTVRSLAALVGGASLLVSETLLPPALRHTTFYRILIGDTQRYLVDRVAQMAQELPETADSATVPADFAQRKVIGAALETAGLLSVQFSPLWIFAIAGDVAAGGQTFLHRLVGQLKKNRVIAPETEIRELTDVLEAMQTASRQSVSVIDAPPLSRAELAKLAEDIKNSYQQMFQKTADLLPRLETLWQQMETVSQREKVSLERVQGILTIDVAEWVKKGAGTAVSFTQTSAELLGETILQSYATTLTHLTQQGVSQYLATYLRPYWQSALQQFHPETTTWTESQLHPPHKP